MQKLFRTIFFFLIALSIGVNYYVFIIQKDFEVLTNEDGPDTSDYFAE